VYSFDKTLKYIKQYFLLFIFESLKGFQIFTKSKHDEIIFIYCFNSKLKKAAN